MNDFIKIEDFEKLVNEVWSDEASKRENILIKQAARLTPRVNADLSLARTGNWKKVRGYATAGGAPVYECSICHSRQSQHVHGIEADDIWLYCPSCGARLFYLTPSTED